MRRTALALLAALTSVVNAATADEVVVYTSVDDVFARPIAQAFERESGIRVRLVPDTEETKSTGLLNRLIAERKRPQADVFWSGDPVRTAVLRRHGVSEPYRSPAAAGLPAAFGDPEDHWTGFSARARVLLYNTRLVAADIGSAFGCRSRTPTIPGKGVHGESALRHDVHARRRPVSDHGRRSRREPSSTACGPTACACSRPTARCDVPLPHGDCALGITDTDDAPRRRAKDKPVAIVFPDADGSGTVIVPNAAMLVKNGPNPQAARRFIDFLLRPETEAALARSDAAQMPLRPGVATPPGFRGIDSVRAMPLDYNGLAALLDELSRGFLKEWVDGAPR